MLFVFGWVMDKEVFFDWLVLLKVFFFCNLYNLIGKVFI